MLITVIILAALLAVTGSFLLWQMLIIHKAHTASLDALFIACMDCGVDLAKTDVAQRAQEVLNTKFTLIEERNKALYEVRRQRYAIIDFVKSVREFQGSLDAAPGIHVRKEMVLEFVGDIARHFKLEKI